MSRIMVLQRVIYNGIHQSLCISLAQQFARILNGSFPKYIYCNLSDNNYTDTNYRSSVSIYKNAAHYKAFSYAIKHKCVSSWYEKFTHDKLWCS